VDQDTETNAGPVEPAGRRIPKQIAVINADYCTGCEACIAVCPVDCIELIKTGLQVKGTQVWCEIDLARCIGCGLCVRLPKRRAETYELKICPWDAIEMVPPVLLLATVASMGGPAWYVRQHQPRLLAAARRLACGN